MPRRPRGETEYCQRVIREISNSNNQIPNKLQIPMLKEEKEEEMSSSGRSFFFFGI
jgi:hypothetical protein